MPHPWRSSYLDGATSSNIVVMTARPIELASTTRSNATVRTGRWAPSALMTSPERLCVRRIGPAQAPVTPHESGDDRTSAGRDPGDGEWRG